MYILYIYIYRPKPYKPLHAMRANHKPCRPSTCSPSGKPDPTWERLAEHLFAIVFRTAEHYNTCWIQPVHVTSRS